MPVSGHRYALESYYSGIYRDSLTQYVDGALIFAGPTTVYLNSSMGLTAATYCLFDYSSAGATFPGGQAELDNYVLVDISSVTGVNSYKLINSPNTGCVLLELSNLVTNYGTQYVVGNLDFGNHPTEVYLDDMIFTDPGTYDLFVCSGVVSNLNNLRVIPQKSGLTVHSIWISSNTVKVKIV